MKNPYATNKLLHHPDLLADLRERHIPPAPLVVHLMPELGCNQRCAWCAFRAEGDGWKNQELMDPKARLTWEQASRFLDDFEAMGGRAIELTGGGEPLMWPEIDHFLNRMHRDNTTLELALVTNGVLLSHTRAEAFGRTRWKWARVSIDAGTAEQYATVRRVPWKQWERAWDAVELLAIERDRPTSDPERMVGVGYVVDVDNFDGVYKGCDMAYLAGADNIRIGVAFTPQHLERFPTGALAEAAVQAQAAKDDFSDKGLLVVDLVSERGKNLAHPTQGYDYCATKDVLCVVGGDGNVYLCCSLAFNQKGLIGSLEPEGFRYLWEAIMPGFSAWHDPRRDCKVECLYERRNLTALEMLKASEADLEEQRGEVPPHVNYL